MKRHNRLFVVMNIAIPLFVGAFIYYFLSTDVIFVRIIDKVINGGVHFNSLVENSYVVKFIRFYLLDMLWGYALVFTLYFILSNNTANLKKIFFIAFVFSTSMEILQLTSFATGTFDFLDILFEFLAEIFAVLVIKNTQEEGLK